jgi:hypothetical protein
MSLNSAVDYVNPFVADTAVVRVGVHLDLLSKGNAVNVIAIPIRLMAHRTE